MNTLYSFYLSSFIFSVICLYVSEACKGCVNLDEYNIEKILTRFEAVLVKFDVSYPYGDKHDVFVSLAGEVVDNNNFILAQVGVKDYGDKENEALAKKYGINSKEDLPALRLFVEGEDEPFAFNKNMLWNDENIKKFVRDHTNIYLGLPGCLERFDKLAMKFSNSNNKNAVLKESEEEASKLNVEKEKTIANTYIKFMKKVIDSGASFISQEVTRLGKIVKDGKVNEKKKEELSHRLNILKSFSVQPNKSEL